MKRRRKRRVDTPVRQANVKRKKIAPALPLSPPTFAWRSYRGLGLLLTLAAALFLFLKNNPSDQADLTDPPDPITRRDRPAPSDFWNSARAPDPGHDLPVTAICPEDLGVIPPSAPIDHSARIAAAISRNDLPAIQSAALSWFEQDPVAARDWLAMQPTFDDLQPAISYIVSRISEKGDLKTALEWSALLTDGTIREDTLFNIHALALRNHQITFPEINPEGISPERLQELQSGAAGD